MKGNCPWQNRKQGRNHDSLILPKTDLLKMSKKHVTPGVVPVPGCKLCVCLFLYNRNLWGKGQFVLAPYWAHNACDAGDTVLV